MIFRSPSTTYGSALLSTPVLMRTIKETYPEHSRKDDGGDNIEYGDAHNVIVYRAWQ